MANQNKKISYVFIVILAVVIIGLLAFFYFRNSNSNDSVNDINNNVSILAGEKNILDNNNQLNEVNNRIENIVTRGYSAIT